MAKRRKGQEAKRVKNQELVGFGGIGGTGVPPVLGGRRIMLLGWLAVLAIRYH